MKVLVTGGAGYIGGFMTKRLLDEGFEVVVCDSLERGHQSAVDSRAVFKKGNLLDKEFITSIFSTEKIDAVIHFAGYISVNESMENPGMYFTNNVFVPLQLLEVLIRYDISAFIFSSTGTVYGSPKLTPIPESHGTHPENPYAESKLMVEKILHWYHTVHKLPYAVLRYFNACGAALDGTLGELHDPETHIIPNAMKSAKENKTFILYGDDYNTPDGTCIRDYIHVLDLVEAHILTLKKLQQEKGAYTYNVGTGKGYSNKEIIEMIKQVTNVNFPVEIVSRRAGDTEQIIADTKKIREELQFAPKYSDLRIIIESAWKWHNKS